ncbi:NACHT domain protein [Melanomma pulvis-pyrius CBS 109.77]|uniref:NACHT domain protein n=1 Tax=Melanomma pulvis-pyrius CBS 109.77 TaxID=1314802 RepID=A0A6A6X7X6_9PLEO|nr:NACHT domain protein [Melanomma pulvis-pyrius CBS 109.77]
MSTSPNAVQVIFENAIREFKANLKNDGLYSNILKTNSIDEVYDATNKLQEEQAKKGHLRHLSKIEPYLEGLRNYSSVIEVFTQAKPEILALIWGPIKLLLQWASTLKQSFDAIVNTTAEIGVLLPEFQDATTLFSHNKQVNDVLALFFQDILDFYLIALKFFSLTRWKYLFESLWPRHRDKIKVVMNHMERHTLLMRNEVRLEHIQAEHGARLRALEHFERTEKSLRRQDYQNIETNVSPRNYEGRLDWLHGRICEGTGKWLLKDAIFVKWLDTSDTSTKILWLQGIPGAGKTFLSSTVVEKTRSLGHTLFAFLSYNLTSSTSALSIIHSLMFQLASTNDDLQAVLCQSSRENLKSNLSAATDILTTLLSCAGPVYITIDGVDEIDVVERSRLLRQILEMSKVCGETKFIISSRPEADITAILDGETATIRVDNRNSGSIQAFINLNTQKWFQQRDFLPEARAEIEGLLAPLASNSKGMFLYAKIVLSSIEYLDLGEIRNEIRALPETLDDAYARILARINSLRPPTLKDKARKLLGWIGSCSTPLTIHEIEQALVVSQEDTEGKGKVLSTLNIVQICGPIVEVVDDYVQFVHFTVQEYIFSPHIKDSINAADSALSLGICCITYLCQGHHDPEILDEDIRRNILSGAYRLHDFATTMWLELIERFVCSDSVHILPDELISLLEILMHERNNRQYNGGTEQPTQWKLESFKQCWPELYDMLCKSTGFHQICSRAEYHKSQRDTWIKLDPLTISDTSTRIYAQFDQLLCKSAKHKNCHCHTIQRHYSQRPFKCHFLNCSFRRHGFQTWSLRDIHIKHHDRPWHCSFPGCDFEDGGFLSRKMRDDHLDRFHQEAQVVDVSNLEKPDSDEIQPLLFDLVKADKVDTVKAFMTEFDSLGDNIKTGLQILAARFGSPSMLELIAQWKSTYHEKNLIHASIDGKNVENFAYLLSRTKENTKEFGSDSKQQTYALDAVKVLGSGSEEIFKEWKKYVDLDMESDAKRHRTRLLYTTQDIIRSVAKNPGKESLLLMLWKEKSIFENCDKAIITSALRIVVMQDCSVNLAQFLVDRGADINYQTGQGSLPFLQHAARKTTAAAARMMEFLLRCGANPEARGNHLSIKIRDERGAKGISKWLGMSWDEIVAKAQEERAKLPAEKSAKSPSQ